jgi:mono/diheme cytochrome c family protein
LARLWQLAPALFGLTLLSGCEAEYPSDLKYGLRAEPLVVKRPDVVPTRIDRPGEFPNQLMVVETTEKDKLLSPGKLNAAVRQSLEKSLQDHFGTPRRPLVVAKDTDDKPKGLEDFDDLKKRHKLDDATLAAGAAAYRLHCLHCHGLTGNGRGPTAPWVNPHPRDYRQGIFKFTSTKGGNDRKPSRQDLLRTLREGIEGTSMPSFALQPERDLEALASYVVHLSLRGDVEFNVIQRALSQDGLEASEVEDKVNETLWILAGRWMVATEPADWIKPDESAVRFPPRLEDAKAVQHGYEMFRSTSDAGCIACHKDYGRQGAYFFDDWGTIGRPADLTLGVYRGGRRPIDFFYRIHSGVGGSNMPAFNSLLSTKDIWDMVSFLQVLPNPAMRKAFDIHID